MPSASHSPPEAAPARCFVAVLPDAGARAQLDALGAALAHAHPGARRVAARDLHLTLAFIGALAAPAARRLAFGLCALEARPFEWRIDRVGGFARARVAWAGGPPQPRLERLAAEVRGLLDQLGLPYDRQAFAAHVTLLRHTPAAAAQSLAQPIHWRVGGPLLMVSERDARGQSRYRAWVEEDGAAGAA